jgi:trehalose transport system permease protein
MAVEEAAAVRAATRPGPPGRRGGLLGWARRNSFQILLVTPLLAYVLILTVAPIVDTIRYSFSSPSSGFGTLSSYQQLFHGFSWTHWPIFERAIANTVIVALLSLALELGIGLAVALAIHVTFFGRGFVRTVLLVPLGVPTIVSGAVMLLIFQRSGYMNSVMGFFAGLISKLGIHVTWQNVSWQVAGGIRTLFIIAIADMWKVLPVITLIFLAGLQSIPQDVYEAADVDGATKWQRFSRVTLPLLVPYITMALILRAIDAFRIFELALVLAGGVEPVLGTYIANQYLPPQNDVFSSSAASIVLFAIIMVFIVLYLRFVARFQVQR